MNERLNIIIIGGDHYNTYGVVRSLGEIGIKSSVLILAHSKRSFVLKSRYIDIGRICFTHDDCISSLLKFHKEDFLNIVIACGDDVQELLLDNYDVLCDKFILPVGNNPALIKDLMNKDQILVWAKKYGINIPKTVQVLNRELPEGIEYPCLTKPLTSISGHKSDIVVCHNEDELKAVILDESRCSDFIVQQYIDFEKEISILGAVLNNGEVVFSGCIDKLRTCMIGTSSFAVMTGNEIIGDNKDKIATLLKESGYRGLFSAEFLKKGESLFFLEINFRNDGNTYVATASGLNLPYIYVMSYLHDGFKKCISPKYPCFFMLELEDYYARKKNGVSKKQWNNDFEKAKCKLVYNIGDIEPYKHKKWLLKTRMLRIIMNKLRLIFQKIIEKLRDTSFEKLWRFFCIKVIHTYGSKAHYLKMKIDIEQVNKMLNGFDLPVKELTYDDFLMGDPVIFTKAKLDLYKERLKDNTYKAYGIISNNRLIYSTWISYYRMGMSVEVSPIYLDSNEGYLEDSYCAPIARGKGLHSRMNNFRIKKIFESGRDTVVAIVQHNNTPAFKVQSKSGLKEVGTFRHGYFFGIKYNTFKKKNFKNNEHIR